MEGSVKGSCTLLCSQPLSFVGRERENHSQAIKSLVTDKAGVP
jgi:hypothetical protein